ncbi:hypothetical protein KKE06_00770 [Candidatus Micrarchaeota archaeon]|nr:hypothetical protein [Candidatus Micrarchaeota archaeon]MBU1930139.1 hypothetical protein [Candidatus Micrarchaeota archaeon]
MQNHYWLLIGIILLLIPSVIAGPVLEIKSIQTRDSEDVFKEAIAVEALQKIQVIIKNTGDTCGTTTITMNIVDLAGNSKLLNGAVNKITSIPAGETTIEFEYGPQLDEFKLVEETPPENYRVLIDVSCSSPSYQNARALVFSIIEVGEVDVPEIPVFFVLLVIGVVLVLVLQKPPQKSSREH